MIKFSADLTVKKIEDKSVRKRDGDMFSFTEVTLEQGGKRPTVIVARADDSVVSSLQPGVKGLFSLAISSFTTNDGRTFNNFLITEFNNPASVKETIANMPSGYPHAAVEMGDDIPF